MRKMSSVPWVDVPMQADFDGGRKRSGRIGRRRLARRARNNRSGILPDFIHSLTKLDGKTVNKRLTEE